MKNGKHDVFLLGMVVVLILTSTAALAHTGEDELAVGKELIEEGSSCDELDDEQLEAVGEYLMEQMHPGEAHELMHQRMGIEEGTPYHERFHINMAQAMYCNAESTATSGMMQTMPMMRMMPMMSAMAGQGTQGKGMMGSWGYGSGYGSLVSVLYVLLLLGLIALVYFWIVKLWKSGRKKR